MARALLVPHQDVLDLALLENLVVDRKNRATGITEEVPDAMIGQRPHDHRGTGHLVRIVTLVALVGHRLLRIRYGQRLLSVASSEFENKKGPKRPLHTARIGMTSAIPGGAPGYDDEKFGNKVSHIALLTFQRLRDHSVPTRDVKGRTHSAQIIA